MGGTPTNEQLALARKRIDYLVGADGMRRDAGGNSDLMASFIALAQVSGAMRDVMELMPDINFRCDGQEIEVIFRS